MGKTKKLEKIDRKDRTVIRCKPLSEKLILQSGTAQITTLRGDTWKTEPIPDGFRLVLHLSLQGKFVEKKGSG